MDFILGIMYMMALVMVYNLIKSIKANERIERIKHNNRLDMITYLKTQDKKIK